MSDTHKHWRPGLCRLGIHRWRTDGGRYMGNGRKWTCERCATQRYEHTRKKLVPQVKR